MPLSASFSRAAVTMPMISPGISSRTTASSQSWGHFCSLDEASDTSVYAVVAEGEQIPPPLDDWGC